MTQKLWKYTCGCYSGEFSAGAPTCSGCGQVGQYDGWHYTMHESMAKYQKLYGLKPIGPHRKIADELFEGTTRRCETCQGKGLEVLHIDVALDEGYRTCSMCSGLGCNFTRSADEISAIRQRVLESFPDAGVDAQIGDLASMIPLLDLKTGTVIDASSVSEDEQIEFVYYATPEGFAIATRDAVDELLAAKQCKTWGEYADLCEMSWEEMLEGYEGEIGELTGQENPSPGSTFEFDAIRGLYYSGDLITDPRTDAYETLLRALPQEIRSDQRLAGKIGWSHGSPAGHLECVTATSEDAVRLFERILHEKGFTQYVFRRDDSAFGRMG